LWVDSAATVHNIRDSDNQADHRTHKRIRFPVWELDSFELTKVIHRVARAAQVTIEGGEYCGGHAATPPKRTYLNPRKSMAEPTYEELKAKLSQLEKEVETKKRSGDLIFKVGEKGGVSVYGLGRFPVTLYYEQWNRLLGAAADIQTFLEENKSRLKLKEQG
jgi:hypothetical protein